MSRKYIAQEVHFPGITEAIKGPVPQFKNIADIINKLIPLLFAAAGLILGALFISGGFDLLLSGGDPKKAESAKGKITNAIVGFIIIFVAWWLTQILAKIFGLEGL